MSAVQQSNPERFAVEVRVMSERTRARLVRLQDGNVVWEERLRSTVTGRSFHLRIAYPDGFPYEAPKAFIVEPEISPAPHRLSDGSLCLFSDHVGGVGTGTTALLVRNRAVLWFLIFEVWQRTGEWMPLPASR